MITIKEKLVDKRAYLQVIGCLLKDSTLIDDIDRPLDRKDFNTEDFYELLFVAIYNLHVQGCNKIDEFAIDSYLSNYKKQYEIFKSNNGLEYLSSAKELSSVENYDLNYHKMRKLSLLRYYESKGLDTSFIYNTAIIEPIESEKEQTKFDNYTEQDIVDNIESLFVIEPNIKYCSEQLTTDIQAADGMVELVRGYKEIPDVGLPFNNVALNTVARGARLGCLLMDSSNQGGGKTRRAVANACKFSIPYIYDKTKNDFNYTGMQEPTVFFTTEMQVDEIQTLVIAFVSKVNEEHILYGTYDDGEEKRVDKAIEFIQSSPLYIVHIPDFSIQDIKNQIKKYNREYMVNYIFFDYIHTSLRLMAEITGKSKVGLKEHQLLLVFATELKTIAQQLNVFIYTSSQLNGESSNATYKDQNILAGAKSLANKLDVGIISMRPNNSENKKLKALMRNMIGVPMPNMGHWIYKIRRGKLTRIVIWSKCDLGTMEEEVVFVTDYDFNLIDIDFTNIEYTNTIEEKINKHSVLLSNIENGSIYEEDEKSIEEDKKRIFDW